MLPTCLFIACSRQCFDNLKRFVIIDSIGRVVQIAMYGLLTSGYGLIPSLGLLGIPLTDIVINFLLCAAMLYHLRKKIGSYGLTQIVLDGVKILIAAIASIVPAFVFLIFVDLPNPLISLAIIAGFGILALVIYYWMCKLLKVPEIEIAQSLAGKALRIVKRGN